MDWARVNLRAFIRGPLVGTPEGLLVLIGTSLSLLFAGLSWYAPGLVGLRPQLATGNALIFAIWPVPLFVGYVAFCSPDFRPTVFSIAMVFCMAAFPFWLVYK